MVRTRPGNAGDEGSIPGPGRSPGGGHDKPLQYSYLGNPMDREAWRATVHGVAKSWTWLKQLSKSLESKQDYTHCCGHFWGERGWGKYSIWHQMNETKQDFHSMIWRKKYCRWASFSMPSDSVRKHNGMIYSAADQSPQAMRVSFHFPESLKPAAIFCRYVGNGVENCHFR